MDYLEITGTALGLLYLWLEYRASVWLWVAGIAMPAVYLKVYYDAGLYADLGISLYYLLASVYGLICWLMARGKSDSAPVGASQEIVHTPRRLYIPLTLATAVLWLGIGYILQTFTDSTVPRTDGFSTALSVVAMWMLAKKYVEQWLAWIAADAACTILYGYKGLWFTAGLYALYTVIAVFGYRKWLRMMKPRP